MFICVICSILRCERRDARCEMRDAREKTKRRLTIDHRPALFQSYCTILVVMLFKVRLLIYYALCVKTAPACYITLKAKSLHTAQSIRNTKTGFLSRTFGIFFLLLIVFQLSVSLLSGLAGGPKNEAHFAARFTISNTDETSNVSFPWYALLDLTAGDVQKVEETDSEKDDGMYEHWVSLAVHTQKSYLLHQIAAEGAWRNFNVLLQNRPILPLFIAHHSWKTFPL